MWYVSILTNSNINRLFPNIGAVKFTSIQAAINLVRKLNLREVFCIRERGKSNHLLRIKIKYGNRIHWWWDSDYPMAESLSYVDRDFSKEQGYISAPKHNQLFNIMVDLYSDTE